MFPALGFGAKLPNGTVSHEFYLVSFEVSNVLLEKLSVSSVSLSLSSDLYNSWFD